MQQVRPLTDRERAIRWLKLTAVAVSSLMFVWLLLWLVFYHPVRIDPLAFYNTPEGGPLAVSFTLDQDQLQVMEYRHTSESVRKTKADYEEKYAKKIEIHLRQGRPFYGQFALINQSGFPLTFYYKVIKEISSEKPTTLADLKEMTLSPRETKTIAVTLDPAEVPVTSNNSGRLYLKLFADRDGKLEITLKGNTFLKDGIRTFQHPAIQAVRFEEIVVGHEDPIIPSYNKKPGAKYSVLRIKRDQDDPVVDPFFPRDILCDVSYGPEGMEVLKRNEDLIARFNQSNKNRLRHGMFWPGDEITYYFYYENKPLPEVFYSIRKLAEDKPPGPDEPLLVKDTPAIP